MMSSLLSCIVRPRALLAVASVAALGLSSGMLAGCSDDDDGGPSCAAALLPGDLVITEVMPNPDGADDGKEWFEVYNNTAGPLDIGGVTLVYSRTDGTGRKEHVVEKGTLLSAGEYYVFGGVLPVAQPAHVDYAYGDDLGSLTNTGGRLAIECDDTLVDEVVYLEAGDGHSLIYDGANVPDAVGNDDLEAWCESEEAFDTDFFASPGAENEACPVVVPEGTCLDGSTEREIVPPAAGDVVITEIMADPDTLGDSDGEWFEVYFAQAADLNGLQLGDSADATDTTLEADDCLHVEAGSYVVFARNLAAADASGIPNLMGEFGFALNNSNESVLVSYENEVLDQVSYASTETGASLALSPDHLSAAENDDPANWCTGVMPYSAGDLGTPGEANTACDFIPCWDEGLGTVREVSPPQAGDVVITEILVGAEAPYGSDGEWVEVYFAQAADLNGLVLGDTTSSSELTVEAWECITVTPGTYAVFARDQAQAVASGVTEADIYGEFPFAVNNSSEGIYVVHGGATLDEVAYGSEPSTGVAFSLSSDALDSTSNDDVANWCDATAPFGGGGLGSPGSANPTCQ